MGGICGFNPFMMGGMSPFSPFGMMGGGPLSGLFGAMFGGQAGGAIGGLAGLCLGGPMGMMLGGGLGQTLGALLGFNAGSQQGGCGGGCGCGGYGAPAFPYPGGYPGGCFPGGGFNPFQMGGFPGMSGGFPGFPSSPSCGCPCSNGCPGQSGGCGNGNYPGQLQGGNGQPITYTTSNGYQIQINGSTVTTTAPNGQTSVQQWGDPHEKVNGQAVSVNGQDDHWTDNRMTLDLGGQQVQLQMNAPGADSPTTSTTIMDGNRVINVNNSNNTVTSDTWNPYARMAASSQPTGETQYFGPNGQGGYNLTNLYDQQSNGQVIPQYKNLGNFNNGQGYYGNNNGQGSWAQGTQFWGNMLGGLAGGLAGFGLLALLL